MWRKSDMDKELEVLKRILEQRVRILCVVVSCISVLVLGVIANKVHPLIGGENYADFMSGVQVGLLIALDLIIISYICTYSVALKDGKKLKKLYLEENDERVKYIEQMAGKSAYKYVIIILVIAACIAGYFSIEAFAALMGAVVIEGMVIRILKLYYSKKLTGNEE
jgi:hypothetical protein